SGRPNLTKYLCQQPEVDSLRHVNGWFDRVTQPVVAHICGHAYNLEPALAPRSGRRVRRLILQSRNPNLAPDGIAFRPIHPRHGLVNHRERRTAHGFRVIPRAALSERNMEHWKILGTDEIHFDLAPL